MRRQRKENSRIKLPWFIHDVNGLLSQTEKAHDHAKEVLEGLDQKLSRVEYEELSSQVYDYEEEKIFISETVI